MNNALRQIRLHITPTVLLLILLLLEVGLSERMFAQSNPCDPNLITDNGPSGYRLRGDRCEGIYIRELASTKLVVAGLTDSYEEFNPFSGKALIIGWTALGNGSVHLRAVSLKRRFYYRMDTVRSARSAFYAWPTDLLSQLNITKGTLGIVGWTQYSMGNTFHDIYVPLRIRQQNKIAQSNNYQLTLVPGAELSKVYLSMRFVTPKGRLGSFIIKDQPLKSEYLAAERSFNIPIPKPKTTGIYRLEIGATLQAGGSASTEIWFYHSD